MAYATNKGLIYQHNGEPFPFVGGASATTGLGYQQNGEPFPAILAAGAATPETVTVPLLTVTVSGLAPTVTTVSNIVTVPVDLLTITVSGLVPSIGTMPHVPSGGGGGVTVGRGGVHIGSSILHLGRSGVRTFGSAAPGGGGGSAFAPDDIAGMALWLDASTLSLANNDPVSSWTDVSGNATHAVQATGAKQPLFKTGVLTGYQGQVATPRPFVRFDGSDDFLLTPAINLSAGKAATIFIVCGNITAGAQAVIVETSANYAANSGAFRITREADNTVRSNLWTTGGGATGAAAVTLQTMGAKYGGLSAFVDTAEPNSNGSRAGKTAIYYNNGERDGSLANDSGVTANLGNHAMYIGARAGTSLFMAGDIAEIIVYTSHFTHRDRGRVDLYLRDKYDLYS